MSQDDSVFISYSGDHDRIAAIATALRRQGLRPWRDADNLPLGARTRDEILNELAGCRAAMIWLTRTTLDSAYVKRIELPAIFEQHERRGLVIVPVFVDWDPGADASEAMRAATGHEIGDMNGFDWDRGADIAQGAARLARRYAPTALYDLAASGNRPIVRCATRTDAAPDRDAADVNLDWRAEYPSDGSLPDPATALALRSALSAVSEEVIARFGAGDMRIAARCHLHLGVALGHAFRRPTGMTPVMWIDGDPWRAEVLPPGDTEPLRATESVGPVAADRASVEISISRDIADGVSRTIAETGTAYAVRSRLVPPNGSDQSGLPDSATANIWAAQAADLITSTRARPGIAHVDLYLSTPIQFAVLLGWRLNVSGGLHVHHWQENAGPYRNVWKLPPS
jgi:hypothetical protein